MEEMTNVIEEVLVNNEVVDTVSDVIDTESVSETLVESNNNGLIAIAAVAAVGVGAFAWRKFKNYKQKKEDDKANMSKQYVVTTLREAGRSEEEISEFVEKFNKKIEKVEAEVVEETNE